MSEIVSTLSIAEEPLNEKNESSMTRATTKAAVKYPIYLRTEKKTINLKKKLTVGAVAAAIAAAVAYGAAATFVTVAVVAVAAFAAYTAAELPRKLYATTKVYRTKASGKLYTRYKGKFYYNAKRTDYCGAITYSKRLGR